MNELAERSFHNFTKHCRTCRRQTYVNIGLQECITTNTECNITYGDLLKELLQVNFNAELENLMPQNICKKCSTLLRNIHKFTIKAKELQEQYLKYINQIKNNIKDEDCLLEAPTDLKKMPDVLLLHVKCEPPETPDSQINLTTVDVNDFDCNSKLLYNSSKVKIEIDDCTKHDERNLKCAEAESKDCQKHDASKDNAALISNMKGQSNMLMINEFTKNLAVRCNICDKVYKNSKNLEAHKLYTHMAEEKKIPCALCNFKSSRISCLKIHMSTMHGPDSVDKYIKAKHFKNNHTVVCNICKKTYSHKDNLRKHFKKKHKCGSTSDRSKMDDCTIAKITPKNRDSFLCPFCGRSFTARSSLLMHSRQHTGERPYKCDLCNKAFMRQQDMKLHRVIHSDEKPHQCSICGKSFKRVDKLTTHMRVHSELRPYKCSECGKTFKYSSVLRTHMHIHTGEKPFSCKTCGEQFSLRTSLNVHCLKNAHTK